MCTLIMNYLCNVIFLIKFSFQQKNLVVWYSGITIQSIKWYENITKNFSYIIEDVKFFILEVSLIKNYSWKTHICEYSLTGNLNLLYYKIILIMFVDYFLRDAASTNVKAVNISVDRFFKVRNKIKTFFSTFFLLFLLWPIQHLFNW